MPPRGTKVGDFYYDLAINTDQLEAELSGAKASTKEYYKISRQLGSSWKEVSTQIKAGNLPQKEGLATLQKILKKEQERASLLKGKATLDRKELAFLKQVERHQKELTTMTKKGIGEQQTGFKGLFSNIKAGYLAVTAAAGVFFGWVFSGFKKLVSEASNFNEASSKNKTVFKDIQSEADKTARALINYGFSLSEATSAIADTGDVLTGLNFNQTEALKMSDAIARLGQDLTSFTNYAGGTKQAIEVLTKGILGERDGLVGLGIKLTETQLKRKGYNESLSAQQKAEITFQAIMEQSKNAIGDYGRTQDQYANQQRKFTANLKDLALNIGQKVLPTMGEFIGFLNRQFEKSEDLEQTTSRLTELLKQRKTVTDKLSGALGDLNEEESRNLEIQKLQIQKELNEVTKRLIKNYKEYYRVKKSAESIEGGTFFGKGNSKIEALVNLAEKIKNNIDETNKKINSGFYDPDYISYLAIRQKKLNDNLLEINSEIVKARNDETFAVQELAKALKENLLTEQEIAYFPTALKNQIVNLANDPKFLTALDKPAEKQGKRAGSKAGTAWKISFLDKLNLKEELGENISLIIDELQNYIKVNQVYFDKYKKQLLEEGKLSEAKKKFIDEYLDVQNKLNGLLEKEQESRRNNVRLTGQEVEAIRRVRDPAKRSKSMEEMADSLKDAVDYATELAEILGVDIAKSGNVVTDIWDSLASKLPGIAGVVVSIFSGMQKITESIIEAVTKSADLGDTWENIASQAERMQNAVNLINAEMDNSKQLGLDTKEDILSDQEKYLNLLPKTQHQQLEGFFGPDGILTEEGKQGLKELLDDLDKSKKAIDDLNTTASTFDVEGWFLSGKNRRIKEDDAEAFIQYVDTLKRLGILNQEQAGKLATAGIFGSKNLESLLDQAQEAVDARMAELDALDGIYGNLIDGSQELSDIEKEELETLTAQKDVMQDQLDILTKIDQLKKSGLYDEQNIYQAQQIARLADSEGLTTTQRLDLVNSLNMSQSAASKVVTVWGGINTEINESSVNSVDKQVEDVVINALLGR